MSGLKKLRAHVLVCEHKTCLKRGGRESTKVLKRALKENDMHREVLVTKVDCLDQCEQGPVMAVYPDGVWYGEVDAACAREIVELHLKHKHVVRRKILRDMRDVDDDSA
jgi:(2Fe-2S) ferredoxin